MRILILSFYFRPDLSAGSFRSTALVNALHERAPAGSQIDVITTLPNRYPSFVADAPRIEQRRGLSITRLALPRHVNGIVDQAKAFVAFFLGARRETAKTDYDIVFATSSRLLTAVAGAWIARKMHTKLYLDLRDIFADAVKEMMPGALPRSIRPLLLMAERFAVQQADKVNLVSPGFEEYFAPRYPRQRFSYFTNGIDDEFLTAAPRAQEGAARSKTGRIRVLYAGNFGEGQGMHLILPRLAKLTESRVDFKIIGDGNRKGAFVAGLASAGVNNVELLPPMRRSDLLDAYGAADVLFLHLNDHENLNRVLPSKLFEYAAMGKPLWAGVSGYAAEFIRSEIPNAAIFRPCDAADGVRALDGLTIHDTPRPMFLAKYARATISRAMADDILAVARGE